MEPERGDKRVRVTRGDIANAARSIGISPGDVMLFHSSLSSMGTVVGGPNAVIDGFLDAVGPAGTVAAPTLCPSHPDKGNYVFDTWDAAATPCYVGAIPETLRRRPDSVRSDHATHSVAAIGARAVELTGSHGAGGLRQGPFGPKAFAGESPWARLAEWDAAYCFIGVTFRVCTMVHYVETLLVQRALDRAAPDRRDALEDRVQGWQKPGVWPSVPVARREDIEAIMADKGLVQYGLVGSATLRCVRARALVDEWLAIVEAEPGAWLPDEYMTWLAEVEAA